MKGTKTPAPRDTGVAAAIWMMLSRAPRLLALCLIISRGGGSSNMHKKCQHFDTGGGHCHKLTPRLCLIVSGSATARQLSHLHRSYRNRQLLRAFEGSSSGGQEERGLRGVGRETPDASPLEQALSLKDSGTMSPLERALFAEEPPVGCEECKSPRQPHGTFLDSLLENFIAADVEVSGRYIKDGWVSEDDAIPLREEDFDGPRKPAEKPRMFADEFLAINEPLGGRFVVDGWLGDGPGNNGSPEDGSESSAEDGNVP